MTKAIRLVTAVCAGSQPGLCDLETDAVPTRSFSRRISPQKTAADLMSETALHQDAYRAEEACRAEPVDDKTTHRGAIPLNDDPVRRWPRVRSINLDQEHGVIADRKGVRACTRLGIAVDCHAGIVGQRRQRRQRADGVDARAGGVEDDRVGARSGVGVEDRLAQGAGSRVVRVGDRERRRSGGCCRHQADDQQRCHARDHREFLNARTPTTPRSSASPSRCFASRVGTEEGRVAKVTLAHAENSDVLPAGSVAVAVMTWPAVFTGNVTLKAALQEPSVVTVVEPRNLCPSPYPEGSQEGLEKNSIEKVVVGRLSSPP